MLDALVPASPKAKTTHVNEAVANATKMRCLDIAHRQWELLTPGVSIVVQAVPANMKPNTKSQ